MQGSGLQPGGLYQVAGLRVGRGTRIEADVPAGTRDGHWICSFRPGFLELSRSVGLEIFHTIPALGFPGLRFC